MKILVQFRITQPTSQSSFTESVVPTVHAEFFKTKKITESYQTKLRYACDTEVKILDALDLLASKKAIPLSVPRIFFLREIWFKNCQKLKARSNFYHYQHSGGTDSPVFSVSTRLRLCSWKNVFKPGLILELTKNYEIKFTLDV